MALGAGLGILGLVTERTREGLIGLPPLSYSNPDLLLTGVQSLWSLPWRAVSLPGRAPSGASGGAHSPPSSSPRLALAGAWIRRRGRRETLALTSLAFSAGALLFGAWLYSAAVHSGLETPNPGAGLACEGSSPERWDVSAAFETCTWLINDNPKTMKSGGKAWAASSASFSWRPAAGPGWEREPKPRAASLVGPVEPRGRPRSPRLFFFRLVPAAHAYSNWGVRYPAGDGENRSARL